MPEIKWKLHLKSAPKKVYDFLNSSKGREIFWSESSNEQDGIISFHFINGQEYKSKIISRKSNQLFEIEYFNSTVKFELSDDGFGGTDLTMNNHGVAAEEYLEVHAGWVSLLMALKGAVDFNIDLRNHDKSRTWSNLYVDN